MSWRHVHPGVSAAGWNSRRRADWSQFAANVDFDLQESGITGITAPMSTSSRDLAELGKRMRDAQRTYFRTRDHAALLESKKLESLFDSACTEVLEQKLAATPSLFDLPPQMEPTL